MRNEVMNEFLKQQSEAAEHVRKNFEAGNPYTPVLTEENLILRAEQLRTNLLIQEHLERQTVALEKIAEALSHRGSK